MGDCMGEHKEYGSILLHLWLQEQERTERREERFLILEDIEPPTQVEEEEPEPARVVEILL